jgi:flagellar basal-body rod protein FlgB
MDLSGTNGKLLVQLMSASSLRQKVIGNNIANQNVPGFKRQEVRFEELVQEELDSSAPDLSALKPEVIVDVETPGGADGNNVFLEDEVNELRENRLLFELYASIFSGQMNMIQSAIHGDR